MAKIIDPDMLNQGCEIDFDTENRVITLNNEGNLDDGVSLSALYSFCMEEWRNDDVLIRERFPWDHFSQEYSVYPQDNEGHFVKNFIIKHRLK